MPTPSAASCRTMRKSRVALGRGQRRGRLVHDQDARLERERLGDLDELLLADAEARRPAPPGRGRCRAGRGGARAAARPWRGGRGRGRRGSGSRPRKMLAATLSSGTRFSSWWMMATPARSASRTLAKRTGSPSIRISPSYVGVHAGQDLHQRRLAGAVLAHQRVHLAGAEVEVDAVERGDAGEALADALRPQSSSAPARPAPRSASLAIRPALPGRRAPSCPGS